jgi:hypothetical protein
VLNFMFLRTQEKGWANRRVSQGSSSRKDYFSREMCNCNTCSTCKCGTRNIFGLEIGPPLTPFSALGEAETCVSSSTISVTYFKIQNIPYMIPLV